MQNRVGGPSHGHIDPNRVLESRRCHDVAGRGTALDQFHDLPAGFVCLLFFKRVDGQGRGAPGQRHAQHFGDHRHGVGGVKTDAGPGAAGHAGQQCFGLLGGDLAGFDLSHQAETHYGVVFFTVDDVGLHRTAGEKNGREIQAAGGHQHAGGDLVAVGDPDPAVQRMGQNHDFDIVGYVFPAGQAQPHLGEHGDTVANPRYSPHEGHAAGIPDAPFYLPGEVVQMNVAGDDVVVAVGHANEGLMAFEIFFFESGRHEQSPMGQGFNRFLEDIRPHTVVLRSLYV